jgi:anaerobic ribonucleoside-triphosphate reductase
MSTLKKCTKRNGQIVPFDRLKVQTAIRKSFAESKEGNKIIARKITNLVIEKIERSFHREIPSVEDIQDIIEDTLMTLGFKKTSKLYILYREERHQERLNEHYIKNSLDPYL